MMAFMYMVGEYDNCTEFCGGGVQVRDVDCFLVIDGMLNETMDDGNCTLFGLERPDESQVCNERPCPSYIAGDFGMVKNAIFVG